MKRYFSKLPILVALLVIASVFSSCEKPRYEVLAENEAGLRFQDIRFVEKARFRAETGLSVSGVLKGKIDAEKQPRVYLLVSKGDGTPLHTSVNPGIIQDFYAADMKIGKNDSRYEHRPENMEFIQIEIEEGDSISRAIPARDTAKAPLATMQYPVLLAEYPSYVGIQDFQFFIPWTAIEGQPGATELQFTFLCMMDSVGLDEQAVKMFNDAAITGNAANGYIKLKLPFTRPAVKRYEFLVSDLKLDTTMFDVSNMDFSLAHGHNPRAGYPDIFWSVTVGKWLCYSSPRYKNSITGYWQVPSRSISLYEDDQVGLCVFDFDDTTDDDEIGCWNGMIADLLTPASQPKTLTFPNVKYMMVSAAVEDEGSPILP